LEKSREKTKCGIELKKPTEGQYKYDIDSIIDEKIKSYLQ